MQIRTRFHNILALLTCVACGGLLLATSNARGQKIDLNTNGMSDVWEAVFQTGNLAPNADADSDGLKNSQENLAGTDPFSAASATLLSFSATSNSFTLSLPSARGKQYQWQSIAALGSNWVVESTLVVRTGSVVSLTAPLGQGRLFRLAIADVDTDGDGVNDWEEYKLGLDPLDPESNGELDLLGQPLNDYDYATGKLASQNVISIVATDPTATQPDAGQTSQNNGSLMVVRGGFPLNAITVNLSTAVPGPGVAVPGVDYQALPGFVSLPAGVGSQSLTVTPLANTNRLMPAVATLKVQGGPGYSLALATNACVVIYPSTTPNGTGLTGQYYTNASSTYSNAANFNPANLKLTRLDTNINFPNLTNPPPIPSVGYFCVRWTGQVMPQYSETYFFAAYTDDGVKLWVNDQLIVNNWIAKSPSDSIGSITLQAGVRYNIKMEYFQQTGGAAARLYWYSESQPKVIIPMERLFPSSSAPSAITSPLNLVGFLGQPFSNIVTGANSPLSYTASPLPPGLSFNASNGALTGIPSVAGEFQITLTSSNVVGVGSSVVNVRIIDSGSSVTREVWTGVPGTNVADIPLDLPASATNFLGSLEGIPDFGDNYGERIRGYLTAPVTGNYYFWIAASDSAELWVSNDGDPANKVKRSWVTPGGTGSRQWNAQSRQRTPWLALEAGQRYYIEILHKAGAGSSDHWAVGWLQDPTGTNSIASGNGVVPGYVLSRHFDLPPTHIPGTLYAANMVAQGSAVSTGVGTATLRLNADETQAVLSFHYSNLSTPVTAKHVHADPYQNKPTQIIFDIDDATPQPDGSYIWDIISVGAYSAAEIVEVIKEGKAYINIHTVNYPNGEIRGNFTLANGSQIFTPPPAPPSWTDDHSNSNAAIRFLIQATYGPNTNQIALVQSLGYDAWINLQFAQPVSRHLPELLARRNSDPTVPYPGTLVFNTWWRQAINAPDQLRQRVAFALSEVMVVSEAGVLADNGRALSSYYDVLLDHSFGNFRELLEAMTLHPAMGLYLDMRGNDKGDIVTGRHPNENFAREILQLFSVGLYRMWPDGTFVMNSSGELVPTYTQEEILGFSRVFTGWNYYQTNQANGRLPTSFGPSANYTNPMVLVPTRHELGTKRVLDNVVLPQAWGTQAQSSSVDFDTYCLQDLEKALDSIFYNENIGPFICRQLIQRLVTSHPSREYLYRVVKVFNDNGLGVRGDMQSVIKAILLDYEARSSTLINTPAFGKQREPLLRVTAPVRAFAAPSPVAGSYSQTGDRTNWVTTPVPHRLVNGDVVFLTFSDFSGHTPPTSQAYTVQSIPSSNVFTVIPPGQAFGTYTQTNTTITNMLAGGMVTTNIFMVNISGHGVAVGNSVYLSLLAGGTYTQTLRTGFTNMLTGETNLTTNVIILNITGHGLALGDTVDLRFSSGGSSNGVYQVMWTTNNNSFGVLTADPATRSGNAYFGNRPDNGRYQVFWSTNNNWFAVMAPTGNHRPNNNVATIAKITGGGFTQSGTTITMSLPVAHGLAPGNQLHIDFVPGTGTDGIYTVATVPDSMRFTVTAPSSANRTDNGQVLFPLVAPQTTRSGSATLSWNTYSVNYTDNGASSSLSQTPLHSPTVFNFFFPDFKFPGILSAAGLTTPEFMLTSDTEVMFQMNYLYNGVISTGNTNGLSSFSSGDGDLVLDIGPWMGTNFTSNAGIPSLVDSLNSLLIAGQLSNTARSYIISYVANTSNFPYSTPPTFTQRRDRARAVIHLLLTSPEFTIQR